MMHVAEAPILVAIRNGQVERPPAVAPRVAPAGRRRIPVHGLGRSADPRHDSERPGRTPGPRLHRASRRLGADDPGPWTWQKRRSSSRFGTARPNARPAVASRLAPAGRRRSRSSGCRHRDSTRCSPMASPSDRIWLRSPWRSGFWPRGRGLGAAGSFPNHRRRTTPLGQTRWRGAVALHGPPASSHRARPVSPRWGASRRRSAGSPGAETIPPRAIRPAPVPDRPALRCRSPVRACGRGLSSPAAAALPRSRSWG